MPMAIPTTPSFSLSGKRALVTGASRGIGFATACALAQAGAEVTMVARNKERLDEIERLFKDSGLKGSVLALDVTDISAVEEKLGGRVFDILVNNAGTNIPKPFEEITTEDYDKLMNLNVKSTLFVSQAISPCMPAGSSIINISSQLGHVAYINRALYSTSKFAVEGLTRAMAIDLAPKKIRINTICPTYIETDLTKPFFEDPEFRERTMRNILVGRLGRVEDVMGAVVFLASPVSELMTGSSLMLDGGWTAQ